MQKSMLIGVCVAFISTIIAATVGTIAGYFADWRDPALMWLVDLMLVVPSFLLISIVVQSTKGDIVWMILLLALFSWMISSRIVRGMTMSLRDREFVAAARYMGVSNWRIIIRHILPNLASVILVQTSLLLSTAILVEASLSFLGLGTQPPTPSLGMMLAEGRNILRLSPWPAVFAGVAILILAFALNLFGDVLRDRLDPHLREKA